MGNDENDESAITFRIQLLTVYNIYFLSVELCNNMLIFVDESDLLDEHCYASDL